MTLGSKSEGLFLGLREGLANVDKSSKMRCIRRFSLT